MVPKRDRECGNWTPRFVRARDVFDAFTDWAKEASGFKFPVVHRQAHAWRFIEGSEHSEWTSYMTPYGFIGENAPGYEFMPVMRRSPYPGAVLPLHPDSALAEHDLFSVSRDGRKQILMRRYLSANETYGAAAYVDVFRLGFDLEVLMAETMRHLQPCVLRSGTSVTIVPRPTSAMFGAFGALAPMSFADMYRAQRAAAAPSQPAPEPTPPAPEPAPLAPPTPTSSWGLSAKASRLLQLMMTRETAKSGPTLRRGLSDVRGVGVSAQAPLTLGYDDMSGEDIAVELSPSELRAWHERQRR